MAEHRIFKMSVASVYPHYVAKVEKKGRTKAEVDHIMCWLTGYSASQLSVRLEQGTDFKTFFAEAPVPNPSRKLISGSSVAFASKPSRTRSCRRSATSTSS